MLRETFVFVVHCFIVKPLGDLTVLVWHLCQHPQRFLSGKHLTDLTSDLSWSNIGKID